MYAGPHTIKPVFVYALAAGSGRGLLHGAYLRIDFIAIFVCFAFPVIFTEFREPITDLVDSNSRPQGIGAET